MLFNHAIYLAFLSDEVRWCPCVSSDVAYTVAYTVAYIDLLVTLNVNTNRVDVGVGRCIGLLLLKHSAQGEKAVSSHSCAIKLVVDFILEVTLLKFSEFCCHRRVALGEFLNRKFVSLFVGQAQVVL